jgi:hypothetical protein
MTTTLTTREVATIIYAETRTFYDEIEPQLNGGALDHKVLYGPPYVRPPVFFLGIQVGYVAPHEIGNDRESRPPETEYATATSWQLAPRLRVVFDVEFLKRCTGSNINFFRAGNHKPYKRDVPAHLRELQEAFSQKRAERLVRAIQPRRIVVIGFTVIHKFKVARQFARSEDGLVQHGTLWDCPTIAVQHLTAAWGLTSDQHEVMDRALREFLK